MGRDRAVVPVAVNRNAMRQLLMRAAAATLLLPVTAVTNASCHTVTADDACFVHAQWAHSIGLKTHPEWYPGLNIASATFEDVQRMMHQTPTERAKYGCPVPCEQPAWEDPAVNQRRREAPHATLHPFETEALAAAHALDTADIDASTRVLVLSGSDASWTFHFTGEIHRRPSVRAARPLDSTEPNAAPFVPFYEPSFNDSTWSRIAVPSNWEMMGFGVPIYVNSALPRCFAAYAQLYLLAAHAQHTRWVSIA